MSFNALILDDESQSRQALTQKLNVFCPEVTPIFEASGVQEAWNIWVVKKPDILFIDIHLSGELGFDLLDRISSEEVQWSGAITVSYTHLTLPTTD